MPILQEFCQAFQQAINQYESEWQGRISAARQTQMTELRTYLNQCQNPNNTTNALALRQQMIERIDSIPFELFEFLLGTRLNIALEKVLKLPQFNKVQLMLAQCAEMQNTHQAQISEKNIQINTLTHEITRLTQQVNELLNKLEQETTKKDSAQMSQLMQALAAEQKNTAYLTEVNEKLKQSLVESVTLEKTRYEKLLTAHQVLQNKYDALLAEQEKTSANSQDKKSANSFSPAF